MIPAIHLTSLTWVSCRHLMEFLTEEGSYRDSSAVRLPLQDEECWSRPSPFHTCPLLLGRKLPIQVSAPAPVSALCFPRAQNTPRVCAVGCQVGGLVWLFSFRFYFSFCNKSAWDKFSVSGTAKRVAGGDFTQQTPQPPFPAISGT